MQPDPEYLRNYYSSLSDEALLAFNRSDLVEMARMYYDAELSKRRLAPLRSVGRAVVGVQFPCNKITRVRRTWGLKERAPTQKKSRHCGTPWGLHW